MAIIEELDFQATVNVASHPAPEYPDTEPSVSQSLGSNTKKSYSYINCDAESSEFSIKLEVTSPSKDIERWLANDEQGVLFRVDIDGGKVGASAWVFQWKPSAIVYGVNDYEKGLLQKFRFTPVSTVDDASKSRVARDIELTKDLGKIRIRAWRVTNLNKTSVGPRSETSILEGQIAEKALKGKAISHSTTLTPAVAVARRTTSLFKWEDAEASPLAVFYFKYRSTEDLQKELIIPRPRSPYPPLEDGGIDDFANLSREDVERLARERHAEIRKRGRSSSVKRENNDGAPRARRPYKFTRIEGGKEAIDFTEDSDHD